MNDRLEERIAVLCDDGSYDKIVEAAAGIPAGELSFQTALRIALAYNNTGRLQDSIDLLTNFRESGKNDAVWNYYLGYALLFSERKGEARTHLLLARDIDPQVPAEGLLHYCISYDGTPDEEVSNADVIGWMCEMLGGVPDGDAVCIQDIGIRIAVRSEIKKDKACSAGLEMITALRSGESLYEFCAGVGKNVRDAVSAALGSFYLGFYTGLKRMLSGQHFTEITDRRSRVWKVFASNVVRMGSGPGVSETFYWDLLRQTIPDHLGNGNMTFLKIYGAKDGDFMTAECRADDVVSMSMGEILNASVSEWDSRKFTSHKQFFFLVRAEPGERYPYSKEQISVYVAAAMEMFADQDTEYNDIFPALSELTGDADLANELWGFIPELCAAQAFREVNMSERFTITSGGITEEYTRWQITSYNMIDKALEAGFGDGIYPDGVFQRCVAVSATYSVVLAARDSRPDMPEKSMKVKMQYNFREGYKAR